MKKLIIFVLILTLVSTGLAQNKLSSPLSHGLGETATLSSQEKPKEATWIWYPGDYEIWLSNKMQANRTERGAFFPPLWRYYSPYSLVTFRKKVYLEKDDVVTINYEGQAKIQLDGAMHYGDPNMMLVPKGQRTVTIKVYNQEKVPTLF